MLPTCPDCLVSVLWLMKERLKVVGGRDTEIDVTRERYVDLDFPNVERRKIFGIFCHVKEWK